MSTSSSELMDNVTFERMNINLAIVKMEMKQ